MQPGDYFSYEKDGILHTKRVESVHYNSGSPAIYRNLNRWQSFLHRITPRRWQRPLLIREAELPSFTITGTNGDAITTAHAVIQRMAAAANLLARPDA
jgi:UDP-N-acetylmuramoylalanine-D-glutamate ligase